MLNCEKYAKGEDYQETNHSLSKICSLHTKICKSSAGINLFLGWFC